MIFGKYIRKDQENLKNFVYYLNKSFKNNETVSARYKYGLLSEKILIFLLDQCVQRMKIVCILCLH